MDMQVVTWSFVSAVVVLAISVALGAGQRLHRSSANVSWWPL
jgi:hypothetical protein